MSFLTYRELLDQLKNLTDEQLDQTVQIMPPSPDGDKPIALQPVYCLNTVKHFCSADGEEVQTSRNAVDNEHHPEQLVLLSDWNGFDDEGNFFYELREDGSLVGNKTGKVYDPEVKSEKY